MNSIRRETEVNRVLRDGSRDGGPSRLATVTKLPMARCHVLAAAGGLAPVNDGKTSRNRRSTMLAPAKLVRTLCYVTPCR